MIMAMDKNKLIGAKGGLPWHIPQELQYFKRVTMGKPLIMGRKTFDSIGRALPGRLNIVLTQQAHWQAEGVVAVSSLDLAIKAAKDDLNQSPEQEAMIIGGASLCQQAMPLTEKLYLTVIDKAFEGDVWLESFEPDQWVLDSEQKIGATDERSFTYSYQVLLRKNTPAKGV
jgi:dihydrofolate reductase